MVIRCVWFINLVNEEVMARVGPQRHGGGIIHISFNATVKCIEKRIVCSGMTLYTGRKVVTFLRNVYPYGVILRNTLTL